MKARAILFRALLASGSTVPAVLGGQQRCQIPVGSDSTDITVSLLLRTAAPEVAEIANSYRFPRKDLAIIAEGLRGNLAPPGALSLSVTSITPLGDHAKGDSGAVPDITTGVAFVVRRDGRATGLRPHQFSPVPQLDSMLLAAVEQASANGDFTAVLNETTADTLALWAELSQDDSSKRVFGVPLFRMRVPRFRPTKVRPLPGGPALTFPELARRVNATDVVELQFVVGPDGRGDPSRARVLRGRYREFIDEVLRTLPAMRFTPATIRECPQAMWVRHTFQFQIR